MLHEDSLAASPQVFKHNQAARNVLGLLTGKPYLRQAVAVSNYLDYYHYYISDLIAKQRISAPELALIAADLLQLERAMRWPRAMRWQPQDVSLNPPIVLANDLNLARHYELCTKLYFTWNRLCAHANS